MGGFDLPLFFYNVESPNQTIIKVKDNKFFNAGLPILGQLLNFIPENIFSDVVKEHNSDKYYKKFTTREHFVCMFYAVLTRNSSLRDVCKNILLFGKKLFQLGVNHLPYRSTLSDANLNRSHRVFASIYYKLYKHYLPYLKDKSFSLPIGGEIDSSKVEIFDSTTISLFKEILKGAGRNCIDGKKKGGIKAFTKMNLAEGVPNFICFKAAACNENSFLQALKLQAGSIAVFDKGFNKYAFFKKWLESDIFFVTRLRDNGKYQVIESKPFEAGSNIIRDDIIELKYHEAKITRTVRLRLITFKDPISGEKLQFLTNLFDLAGLTIALLYKNRWTIEVLFKQLKQNFELKYFLSDSENGIKIQIWIALILNLIFTLIHKMTKEAEDFSTLVQVAAKNLLSYVSIIKFIENADQYWKMVFKVGEENLEKIQLELFNNSP